MLLYFHSGRQYRYHRNMDQGQPKEFENYPHNNENFDYPFSSLSMFCNVHQEITTLIAAADRVRSLKEGHRTCNPQNIGQVCRSEVLLCSRSRNEKQPYLWKSLIV